MFIPVAIGWSLNASKVRTFGFGTSWMVIVYWSNGTEDIRLIWQTGHVRQLGSMSGALGNIWGLSFIISPSFSLSLWYWAAALAKEFNVKKLSVSYTPSRQNWLDRRYIDVSFWRQIYVGFWLKMKVFKTSFSDVYTTSEFKVF